MRPDRTSSAPLLANTRGGQSTVIEGSGRFIGEPPTGAIGRPPEDVIDGVTLNLVNVPAPLAARTVLGDILSVAAIAQSAARAMSSATSSAEANALMTIMHTAGPLGRMLH